MDQVHCVHASLLSCIMLLQCFRHPEVSDMGLKVPLFEGSAAFRSSMGGAEMC